MNALMDEIRDFQREISERVPSDVRALMAQCTAELEASGLAARAMKAGDKIPDFTLPNQTGKSRRLYDLLANGPVVLSIYRGGWCPYCNMEMRALGNIIPQLNALGATLIGMSPELPDKAIQTTLSNGAEIEVLTDIGCKVCQQLGLVFELAEQLRPIYAQFGIDIPAYNGDNSYKLPIPATFVIGTNGTVHYAFVESDYTQRMEPQEVLEQVKAIVS